jgi:type VI protein secretion system component Hcp
MAIDVYLQIDGIKGESADSEHQGWIECTSVNWKLHQEAQRHRPPAATPLNAPNCRT